MLRLAACLLLAVSTFAAFAQSAPGAKRALLIGISQYAELEGLRYADADVKAFSQVLTEMADFRPSDVTIVLNSEATKSRMVSEIEKVVRASKREPLGQFILMFAGHAMPSRMETGRGGNAGALQSNIFLAPYDASTFASSFYSTRGEIGNDTFINRAWLAKQLAEIDAQSMIVIVDSAYSGNEAFGQVLQENTRTRSDRRIVFLASSRQDQPSAEYAELRHGAVSYAIFETVRRAREDLYEDQRRDLTIGDLSANITALFRQVRVGGRAFDEVHQPVLIASPNFAAVKDMPFITVRGAKAR